MKKIKKHSMKYACDFTGPQVLHAARPGVLGLLELGRLGGHLHLQGQENPEVRTRYGTTTLIVYSDTSWTRAVSILQN